MTDLAAAQDVRIPATAHIQLSRDGRPQASSSSTMLLLFHPRHYLKPQVSNCRRISGSSPFLSRCSRSSFLVKTSVQCYVVHGQSGSHIPRPVRSSMSIFCIHLISTFCCELAPHPFRVRQAVKRRIFAPWSAQADIAEKHIASTDILHYQLVHRAYVFKFLGLF